LDLRFQAWIFAYFRDFRIFPLVSPYFKVKILLFPRSCFITCSLHILSLDLAFISLVLFRSSPYFDYCVDLALIQFFSPKKCLKELGPRRGNQPNHPLLILLCLSLLKPNIDISFFLKKLLFSDDV